MVTRIIFVLSVADAIFRAFFVVPESMEAKKNARGRHFLERSKTNETEKLSGTEI